MGHSRNVKKILSQLENKFCVNDIEKNSKYFPSYWGKCLGLIKIFFHSFFFLVEEEVCDEKKNYTHPLIDDIISFEKSKVDEAIQCRLSPYGTRARV